jgi:hypothetical protein
MRRQHPLSSGIQLVFTLSVPRITVDQEKRPGDLHEVQIFLAPERQGPPAGCCLLRRTRGPHSALLHHPDSSYSDTIVTGLSNGITSAVKPMLAYTSIGPGGVIAYLGMKSLAGTPEQAQPRDVAALCSFVSGDQHGFFAILMVAVIPVPFQTAMFTSSFFLRSRIASSPTGLKLCRRIIILSLPGKKNSPSSSDAAP